MSVGTSGATLRQLLERYPALQECETSIVAAFETLNNCFECGGKLLLCGNGGSAADCEHIVGELMKAFTQSRQLSEHDRLRLQQVAPTPIAGYLAEKLQRALPAISLVSQTALALAVSNDIDGNLVFAQQVFGYGNQGDVLLAISTSGDSTNVVFAAYTAKARGMQVVSLTAAGGGELATIADVAIKVPEREVYKVQELHLPIYHALCMMIEQELNVRTVLDSAQGGASR